MSLSLQAPARQAAARPSPVVRPPVDLWGRAWIVLILAASAAGLFLGIRGTLLALAAAGFLGALAGLRWRPLGLLSIVVLCTIDPIARIVVFRGGIMRFNSLNYLLLFVIVLNAETLLRWRNGQLRLVFALVIVLSLGLLTSVDPQLGVQHVLNLVSLLGVLVYFQRAGNDPSNWLWVGTLGSLSAAAVGVLYYSQSGDFQNVNANAWTYVPLCGLFAACLAAAAGKPRWRGAIALALLSVVNAMWVVLSGSRGGMIVALVCGCYLAMTLKGAAVRFVTLVAAAVAILAMTTIFTEEVQFTLDKVQTLLDSNKTASKRTDGHLDLAIGGWYVFVDHPLGVGTGSFAPTWSELGAHANVPTFRYGHEMQAHSAWVKTLAENGVIGLLCLAMFVSSYAIVGWRSGRRARIRLGVFVTFALGCAFLSSEFASKGLWMLAAAAMVLLATPLARRVPDRLRVRRPGEVGSPNVPAASPPTRPHSLRLS